MADNERLRQFGNGFGRLSEERKEYLMAVLKALMFAQGAHVKPNAKGLKNTIKY